MYLKDNDENFKHVGPGTPMGELLRRFWLPALPDADVPAFEGGPIALRLLGEDLLASREARGGITVTAASHDETPAAYTSFVRGGIVWVYLGPHDFMPQPPDFEWTIFLESRRYAVKRVTTCNWARALEGAIVREAQFLPPFYTLVPPAAEPEHAAAYHGHAWVPIDDERTLIWSFGANPSADWTPERRAEFAAGDALTGDVDETDRRVIALRHAMIVLARQNARGHAPEAALHGDWYALLTGTDRTPILS
jgi:hypothetical protein